MKKRNLRPISVFVHAAQFANFRLREFHNNWQKELIRAARGSCKFAKRRFQLKTSH